MQTIRPSATGGTAMVRPAERWLVIGAGGQVGGALCEALGGRAMESRRGGPWGIDLGELAAVPDLAGMLLDRAAPDVIVVASAMTNVDACEDEQDAAWSINARAPAILAAAAACRGTQVVLLSTDYVFDGTGGPYDETGRPNPISAYGRTKLAGEDAVLSADPSNLVVRTTVVYGPEEQGRNFAYRLARELTHGRPLAVPVDQVGTPTYNRDLAERLIEAVRGGRGGIVHVAGSECLSRSAFARRLAARVGLDPELIRDVTTRDLRQKACRPLNAGLCSLWPGRHRSVEQAADDWRSHPRGRSWPDPASAPMPAKMPAPGPATASTTMPTTTPTPVPGRKGATCRR